MLLNQSLALLMLGFPMGMGMAPELHPDVCIKGQKLWPESQLPCTDRQIRNGQESLLILSSFLLFLDYSTQCIAKANAGKAF